MLVALRELGLWEWYQALASRRTAGFSVNALTWSDIKAFFELAGIHPATWEVATICDIDSEFILSRVNKATATVADAAALKNQVPVK